MGFYERDRWRFHQRGYSSHRVRLYTHGLTCSNNDICLDLKENVGCAQTTKQHNGQARKHAKICSSVDTSTVKHAPSVQTYGIRFRAAKSKGIAIGHTAKHHQSIPPNHDRPIAILRFVLPLISVYALWNPLVLVTSSFSQVISMAETSNRPQKQLPNTYWEAVQLPLNIGTLIEPSVGNAIPAIWKSKPLVFAIIEICYSSGWSLCNLTLSVFCIPDGR